MIENKHKSGNNISISDKIIVKSPEVHLIITRQYLEVGLKNKFILTYKIHLG
jgi:hypothetical protein